MTPYCNAMPTAPVKKSTREEPPMRDTRVREYWGQVRDLAVFAGSVIVLLGICSSATQRTSHRTNVHTRRLP